MHLTKSFFAAISLTMVAFAQEGVPGAAPDSASVDVPFQVRYASNLQVGDSVINITNTGWNGANLFGPGFGGASGNICVNVYAFTPDEQLVSCCSCLVTPNGLVSLSAKTDLASRTLTPIVPNHLVIKLYATVAGTGGSATSCTNSAASLTGVPARGLLAWGTTIHSSAVVPVGSTPQAGPYSITETPFAPASLSVAERASIVNRCTNILGNGSTYGVCSSCRNYGLGAVGSAK